MHNGSRTVIRCISLATNHAERDKPGGLRSTSRQSSFFILLLWPQPRPKEDGGPVTRCHKLPSGPQGCHNEWAHNDPTTSGPQQSHYKVGPQQSHNKVGLNNPTLKWGPQQFHNNLCHHWGSWISETQRHDQRFVPLISSDPSNLISVAHSDLSLDTVINCPNMQTFWIKAGPNHQGGPPGVSPKQLAS
jgi:hypothetical protein